MIRKTWQNLKTWYWRYERHLSSVALIAGFIFDAVALKRVDLFLENFWIVVHLLIAAAGIILLNLYENRRPGDWRSSPIHFFLVMVIQFAFGGLFSTFLVFYFRSATLSVSWPFLAILAVCLIGNELFKQHYVRLTYQVSILFLSVFSFMIYFLPVLLHQIGPGVFFFSGLVSLIILALFVWLLRVLSRERFYRSRTLLRFSIGGIFVLINLLYFAQIIPPLPLALKDAGVYHDLAKTAKGDYVLTAEASGGWLSFFRLYEPFHARSNDPIYAYSAVFSPTAFDTAIVHDWQVFDPTKGWSSVSRITLPIVGGRDGGYRTYSERTNLTPGRWRVNVETKSGQLIGRIKFQVLNGNPTALVAELH